MRQCKGDLRQLQIGNERFLWRVVQLDGNWLMVKVWCSEYGNKNTMFRVKLRFDDYWDNFGEIISTPTEQLASKFALEPVTPKLIRQWVDTATELGWNRNAIKQDLSFVWNDHQLLKVEVVS